MWKGKEKFLKPLAAKSDRKKHSTFDIESNNEENTKAGFTRFEMAGFFDGTNYRFCRTLDELFDHILKKKNRSRVIFAHNGGKFDFLFLMEYLKNVRNQEVRIIAIGPRIVALKIRHGKQWITLQDSFTLLAYSLDELCKVFKTSTQKMRGSIDFEKERVDKENPVHQEYLKADCIALWEIISEYRKLPFVKDVGIRLTRSSVGLSSWRTTLKKNIRTTSDEIQDFVRKSYAGGRCEIFRQIGQGGKRVDKNSLYPTQMLKPLPIEWIGPASSIDDFGFHDVTVEVPDCYMPILWVKLPKLIFPTGVFRGVYFSEELKLAVKCGARILKYHRGEKFSKESELFTDFINRAYRMRLENPKIDGVDHPLNILGKDLMNHTYGKFAEREEKKSLIKVNQLDPDSWPKEFSVFHSEQKFKETGLIQIEKWHRSPHMLCHIASAITAYGRIDMAESIYLPFQDSIYYTDTDSGDLKGNPPTGKELGELKNEFPIKNAFYLLPKGYWIETEDGKIIKKLKGFSKKSLESITYEMFRKGNISSVERKLATFRRALISKNTFLTLLDYKKSVISEYSKRKLLAGGETRPWNYNKGEIR